METLLESFKNLVFFPTELLLAVILFAIPLERRPHFLRRLTVGLGMILLFIGGFAGLLLALGLASTTGEPDGSTVFHTLTWCLLLFLMMTAGLWITMAVPLQEAVYCTSCAYLAEHLAYCVRTLLAVCIPQLPIATGSLLYFLSIFLVYFSIFQLFVRQMVQNRHYAASAVDSFGLTLAVLSVVLVLSAAASQYGFTFLHSIYALLSCLFLLVNQVRQQKRLSLQKELDLQKQLWRQQKAQYEMSRENIEIINRKCHDLKHQVAALKLIRDPEQQTKVIDDLQESVMIYDAILETGNEILDTVLTEKSLICSRHHIVLTCIADGTLLSFMDAVDLYTLFGNALDNAIEASLKLPEAERLIDVQVRQKAGLVLISVTNRFSGNLSMADGLPRTSKGNTSDHGFGLRSIRAVAETYDGLLKVEPGDGQFFLRVTIPIP